MEEKKAIFFFWCACSPFQDSTCSSKVKKKGRKSEEEESRLGKSQLPPSMGIFLFRVGSLVKVWNLLLLFCGCCVVLLFWILNGGVWCEK